MDKHYFSLKGKTAEQFVNELASKTFLVDWCFPNPKLPNGKELCDLLVVFEDKIIIWQIKDLKLDKDEKYRNSDFDKNIRQLCGSYRELFTLKTPIYLENSRRKKELFTPENIQEVYLVSALLGEQPSFSINMVEQKNLVINVFNSKFTEKVLSELDTISDFCEYLSKRRLLYLTNVHLIVEGGEEEILGYYLLNNRSFEKFQEFNHIWIQGEFWDDLIKRPEYLAKKEADEISYLWDELINISHTVDDAQYEIIARELARSNRFERRCLGKSFYDAQKIANEKRLINNQTRRVFPTDKATYCFIFTRKSVPREFRRRILENVCFVARGIYCDNTTVIGIATEMEINAIRSFDFCFIDIPEWSHENQVEMESIQKKTGILTNPSMQKVHFYEYPKLEM